MVEIIERDLPHMVTKTTTVEIIADNSFTVQCEITAIMNKAEDLGGSASFLNPMRQANGKWTSRGYYTTTREVINDD